MAYQVSILPAVLRTLAKLPRPVQKRIQEQINTLAETILARMGSRRWKASRAFTASAWVITASFTRSRQNDSPFW